MAERTASVTVLSVIHRVVTAIRLHLESSVLRRHELSWTAFIVLSIVWQAGEAQTSHVAADAGISKGTLTGVVKTLHRRGLLQRGPHPSDSRLVLLSLTSAGEELMHDLASKYNDEATFVTSPLNAAETEALAAMITQVGRHLNDNGDARRTVLHKDVTLPRRRSGRAAKQSV